MSVDPERVRRAAEALFGSMPVANTLDNVERALGASGFPADLDRALDAAQAYRDHVDECCSCYGEAGAKLDRLLEELGP